MKKLLLFGLFLLNITMAFANPRLNQTQSLQSASTNYQAKFVNQDSTVSILNPSFSNPTGSGSSYISVNSDLDGVCKLYGFASNVENSTVGDYTLAARSRIIINASSQFGGFVGNLGIYVISSITCNTYDQKPIPISTNHSGRFINDDGSVTIKKPMFLMMGGNQYITTDSNLAGVCKLYGLNSYVEQSIVGDYTLEDRGRVVINASSRFSRFAENKGIYIIDSIICR